MGNNLFPMSTTMKENSIPEKYAVRSGTKDSGKEYEINNTSLLALKCCFEELEEFWIASNADGFGELDDIIMYKKRKQSDRGVAYLMQLKHQDSAKPLVTDMFLKDKGDFSLKKYSKCYSDMQNKTETENEMLAYLKQNSELVFIMFTNKRYNQQYTDTPATEARKPATVDFLIKIHGRSPILDDIGSDGDTFKINYEALTAEPNINEDFLKRLYIVTNQSHNYSMQEKIKRILKDNLGNKLQLSPDDVSDIVLKFGTFVGQWAKGHLGKHYPLTKEQILRKLVELLLFPYILIIDGEDNDDRDEEEDIWYDITKDKDVTIIDDADDIVQRFVRNVTNKIICNSDIVNAITEINKHLMRVGSNSKNLSRSEKYELLWKTKNIPLILEVSDERGVRYIREVLNQFPKVFRIIILNKTKTHFEEFGDIKLFVNVSNLSTKHQEYILTKPIKFQGKEGSSIHKLNINLKSLKVKDVVYILCDQFNVGGQFEEVPQFFVEMSLTTHFFNIRLLKGSADIFVVRCGITLLDDFESVLKNQLGIDAKRIIHWERLNEADFNGQIIIFNDIENLQEIESFCLTLTKPVHFLAWHGGDRADLIKSNNINKNLKLQKSTSHKPIKELLQNFYENKQTLIISAIPGMGKSVLINYFALNMPINLLVLNIPLAKYHDHYKNWEGQNSDSPQLNFERFLKKVIKAEQTSNSEIFNCVFNQFLNFKKVVFLLDGLDEVPVHRQNGAIQLIKFINQSGYYTCVTTRPVLEEKLESTLNTFAITLNMFTEDEQRSFLRNYFENVGTNVTASNNNASMFVYKLLEATKSNLNDFDYKFTGVPLQTTLLAEVFANDFLKYQEDGVFRNQRFDLIYLYKHCIDKKIEIACAKVENVSDVMINCFKECRSLYGLRHLFDKQDLQELQIDGQFRIINKLLPDALQHIQKDGITVIDGDSNVTFVHQTFAEYLANWLNAIDTIDKIWHENKMADLDVHPIHLAAHFGHTAALNLILSLNVDANIKCWSMTALIIAAQNNESDSLLLLLKKSADIHAKGVKERTALHYAAIMGHKEIVTILLTWGADIEAPDNYLNLNALHHAARNGHEKVVTILLNKNADINAKDYNYSTPLHYAVCNNHKDVVTVLLTNKANINAENSKGSIPLHEAVDSGYQDIVTLLVTNKADINAKNNADNTPLHLAALKDHQDVITILLANNANINSKNCLHRTPLHCAALYGHEDIVTILLTKNANVNARDSSNETPLHLAVKRGIPNIVNIILDNNADIEAKDSNKRTPLHTAVSWSLQCMINILLDRGANVNASDENNMNPLHIAATKNKSDIITTLLRYGAEIEARSYHSQTPLHHAAFWGTENTVICLLTNNADIEAKTSANQTPLHVAAERGNENVVRILLNNSANVQARNSDKETPLGVAVRKGHQDIITILSNTQSK